MAEISHSAHRIGMEMGTGKAGLQRADMRQSDHEMRQSDPLHRTRRQGVIAAMPIPLSWWVEMSAVSRLLGITISTPRPTRPRQLHGAIRRSPQRSSGKPRSARAPNSLSKSLGSVLKRQFDRQINKIGRTNLQNRRNRDQLVQARDIDAVLQRSDIAFAKSAC